MKGVIIQCFADLIISNFSVQKWNRILQKSGFAKNHMFLAFNDIDDETFLYLLMSICDVTKMNRQQLADRFGEHWAVYFAPKMYYAFYKDSKNAWEFLLKMGKVHDITTKNMPNARPPRFTYEEINSSTLIMKYHSSRGLIEIVIGLIKGVGKYYLEKLEVTRLDDNRVKIVKRTQA